MQLTVIANLVALTKSGYTIDLFAQHDYDRTLPAALP